MALTQLFGTWPRARAGNVQNDSTVPGASVRDALDFLLALGPAPVTSVFGRIGAVVAVAGDYAASLVTNDSGVAGATVKDALNTLGGAVTGVSSVFGRAGAVVAVAGDYLASQVTNDSAVAGAFVKDALNALSAASGVSSVFGRVGAVVAVAGDYAASLVTNDSGVAGATVKDALNTLGGAVTGVSSVFGRAGAVVAVAGDYAASLVTNDSGVAGATVKAALDALLAAIATINTNAVFDGDAAGGDLASTYPNPNVAAIHETAGPTKLTFGAIADAAVFRRSGTNVVGATVPSQIAFAAAGMAIANDTEYLWPCGLQPNAASITTERFFKIAVPGTLKFFYLSCRVAGTAGVGNTITYTVRVNGVDTAITASQLVTATATVSDTTNTAAVAAGDTVSVKITKNGAIATTQLDLVSSVGFIPSS